jgi:hypothetical protein
MGLKPRTFTEEHKRKLSELRSGERNPMYGKQPRLGAVLSKETREKIGEGQRNWVSVEENRITRVTQLERARSMLTPENRGGARSGEQNHMFGLHHSEETIEKISQRAKARFAAGAVNPMQGVPSPMTGKKHSPEAIEKVRAAKRAYWAAKRAASA